MPTFNAFKNERNIESMKMSKSQSMVHLSNPGKPSSNTVLNDWAA